MSSGVCCASPSAVDSAEPCRDEGTHHACDGVLCTTSCVSPAVAPDGDLGESAPLLASDEASPSHPCAVPPLTPRMSSVYERTSVRPHDSVRSILDAIDMPPHLLGKKTEALRRIALREAVESDITSRASTASLSRVTQTVGPSAGPSEAAVVQLAPAPVALSAGVPGPALTAVDRTACAIVPGHRSAAAGERVAVSSYDVEGDRIDCEVRRLLQTIPDAVLLHGCTSILPASVRRANLIGTISQYDAGTIAKGRKAFESWMCFCERHHLPDHGAPFDTDLCVWFLREEDEMARARAASAASSSRRTGSTIKHARACALRWLAAVGCVPFAAHALQVRKSAPPDASREPSMTPMWEVAVVRHLLILVVRCSGPRASLVQAYAASAYLMCLASLRQLDALRSSPPQFVVAEGLPAFQGIAAYTKGHNTRARQRPMPWWVPAVSIEPSVSDDEAATALRTALAAFAPSASSMFMELIRGDGQPCALDAAVAFGVRRARPHHLSATLAYLLTWTPLSFSPQAAAAVASGRHGPRHTLPEVARVLGMPAEARDELGRWKSNGGRLQRHANRYSRRGECLMQLLLRSRLVRRVRQIVADLDPGSSLVSIPLSAFASLSDSESISGEQGAFDDTRQQCLLLSGPQ